MAGPSHLISTNEATRLCIWLSHYFIALFCHGYQSANNAHEEVSNRTHLPAHEFQQVLIGSIGPAENICSHHDRNVCMKLGMSHEENCRRDLMLRHALATFPQVCTDFYNS